MRQSGQFKQQTFNTLENQALQQKELIINQLNSQVTNLQQLLNFSNNQLKLSQQQESLLQSKLKEYEKQLIDQKKEIERLNQQFQESIEKIEQTRKDIEPILVQKDQQIVKLEDENRLQKKENSNQRQIINQFKLYYSDVKQRKPQIKGLVESLMESANKINNWKKNPQLKQENQEFEIFEVKCGKYMNKVLDHKLIFLTPKELQIDSIGKIKAITTTKPVVEGDLQVGYIVEILQSDDPSLKGNFLLRREPKAQPLSQGFKKKNDAANESINNILFQTLLERFQKRQSRDEFLEFKIQRQFVLKPVDLQIYYSCELIQEGEFQKINGGEMQPIINSEFEDYYNFFTFDSFSEQGEELVVSHLSRVGNYFHDMIISTLTGVFTRYDQGKVEVVQTIKNLEKALGFVSQTIQ